MNRLLIAVAAIYLSISLGEPSQAQSSADEGKVLGPRFIGRMVSNLDRSVDFYKAIGLIEDPSDDTAWRKDDVAGRLYGVKSIQTRTAKMYVDDVASGQRFVIYLRELKGLPRKNVSDHTPWEPAATHFGLIVSDADAVWSGCAPAECSKRDPGMRN